MEESQVFRCLDVKEFLFGSMLGSGRPLPSLERLGRYLERELERIAEEAIGIPSLAGCLYFDGRGNVCFQDPFTYKNLIISY